MAKNGNPKAKALAEAASNGAGPESPESLDKVRDILFGGQMRMVDIRLRGLEDRLLEEQAALRADLGKQLAEVDGNARKEVAALQEKLAAERAKRGEDLKALAGELKEVAKGLEKRHGKLEEATAMADADLRDQILKQSTALSTEIARVADRINAALDKSVAELESHKLDTSALVGALTEMASKLGGNGKPSGKSGARG